MNCQLTPFEYGQIKAHLEHACTANEIQSMVLKPDGSEFGITAIKIAIAKITADPLFRGERKEGSGAPRKTTAKTDNKIIKVTLENRGKEIVSANFLRKHIPELKDLSDQTVYDRLAEAGLAYLRRRKITLVPKKHKPQRMKYIRWVLQQPDSELKKWAYSDGTGWYIDRDDADREHTERKALGTHVWRRMDRSDALFEDTVGPSEYTKAQGQPVKVWGLLAKGQLHCYILPKGVHMNRWWYAWLVKERFPQWLHGCKYLVQDFESCLRCDEPLAAMQEIGLELVEKYPQNSCDFNAIENCWALLKKRMTDTMPKDLEDREAFVQRLRNAIAWVNRNHKQKMLEWCNEQKKRAQRSKELKGARCGS